MCTVPKIGTKVYFYKLYLTYVLGEKKGVCRAPTGVHRAALEWRLEWRDARHTCNSRGELHSSANTTTKISIEWNEVR